MKHALTEYRNTKKLSLEQFAKAIGATKSMVWKWENGEAEPRPHYREKIVSLTSGAVSREDLLCFPQQEQSQ